MPTFDDLNLDEDVRQFVKELDARRGEVRPTQKEFVQVETKNLMGGVAEQRRAVPQYVIVNPNSNNTNPNVP